MLPGARVDVSAHLRSGAECARACCELPSPAEEFGLLRHPRGPLCYVHSAGPGKDAKLATAAVKASSELGGMAPS